MIFNIQDRSYFVTLSPSLPLRFAQGFGSLKGKLREGSLSMSHEMLRFPFASLRASAHSG